MNRILNILCVCVALFGTFLAEAKDHYKLEFYDFNELIVVDDINVDYVCDPTKAGTVEFDAPKDLVSSIFFEPSKTKLSIKLASSETPYADLPTVTVYSSYLSSVKNDGDSLVRILSVADGPKLSCRVIGNGRIEVKDVKTNEISVSIIAGNGEVTIAGECKLANLSVTGSGIIHAEKLRALEISCTASHGTVNCNAVELLSVGGVSGKVNYLGTPKIKKRFLSHVKLTQIQE